MKKIVFGIILGIVVGVAVSWSLWRRHSPAPAAAAEAAAPAEKPKENPLHLTAAKRAAAGVTLVRPEASSLPPEVTAFGRVLDPTPLIALIAEVDTASAAANASEKDAVRVQKLADAGGNASAQAVETAVAAAARDRAALVSARARLAAAWGRAFIQSDSLKSILDALDKGAALVRIDALPGETVAPGVTQASLGLMGTNEAFPANIVGPAPTVDPQVQGASFLALVSGHPLPFGAALHATLAAPGQPQKVLVVPRTAIVYHEGSAWVYTLGEEDTFERKIVTLGRSLGDRVAITNGIEESDQVAATGAGQLLSAELQAGGAPDES